MHGKLSTSYIFRRLRDLRMVAFAAADFARVFGLDRERSYAVLGRLVASGGLARVGHGSYVVARSPEEESLGHAFFLGTRLVSPSYVSFWSALHHYGWTEQMPRQALFATTRRSRRAHVGAFPLRFVCLARSRFFGYAEAREGSTSFPIADSEKAIFDSLCLPQYSGGMGEVAKAIAAAEDLRAPVLAEYAARIGVRTVNSRLGFLLERGGVDAAGLRRFASKTFISLDPEGPRRGRYNARWRVIDNLEEGG
jgi:predicted transcriptional regulator of viral defense system